MKRHYYVASNLNEVETVKHALREKGVSTLQMHLLTDADAEADRQGIQNQDSITRKDVPRSFLRGFCIGLIAVALLVAVTLVFDIPGLSNGLMLFIASVILLGFCTWEGGLFGIQRAGRQVRRFEKDLHQGKHVFYVDVDDEQRGVLDSVMAAHPGLRAVGTDTAESSWKLNLRRKWRHLSSSAP